MDAIIYDDEARSSHIVEVFGWRILLQCLFLASRSFFLIISYHFYNNQNQMHPSQFTHDNTNTPYKRSHPWPVRKIPRTDGMVIPSNSNHINYNPISTRSAFSSAATTIMPWSVLNGWVWPNLDIVSWLTNRFGWCCWCVCAVLVPVVLVVVQWATVRW